MRLQGLEPWTNRLRVYCSTNWAKGAYFCFSVIHRMIHSLNTNKIIKDSAEKSNLFFHCFFTFVKNSENRSYNSIKFHNFFVYFRLFRRRLQWQPNLLLFLVFLFQKLLQLLHGFLDFIKTAAAGIFILIAEILEFLLKETWFSDQTSSPLSGVPDTGTGKVLFLLYYTGNVKNDQKIACFSHCFPIFFPL